VFYFVTYIVRQQRFEFTETAHLIVRLNLLHQLVGSRSRHGALCAPPISRHFASLHFSDALCRARTGIVGRSPTVSTSPVVHAVSQTIADSLLTANLTAATAAISFSAKGVALHIPPSAHLSWGCSFDLGLDPLVVQAVQTSWRRS